MNISDFTENYARLGDAELLRLWADRETLLPEATMALDSELQRRGLDKQSAARVKKRLDALAARESKGPLSEQVAAAKYERNIRHFVGWQEPEFYSHYGSRDVRRTFAYFRHKYRVWRAFRDHTGHWPVFSIWFYFLSWILIFGFTLAAIKWADEHKRFGGWNIFAAFGCILALIAARQFCARLVRKLDWKVYGSS